MNDEDAVPVGDDTWWRMPGQTPHPLPNHKLARIMKAQHDFSALVSAGLQVLAETTAAAMKDEAPDGTQAG